MFITINWYRFYERVKSVDIIILIKVLILFQIKNNNLMSKTDLNFILAFVNYWSI